jgi:hypothetical protein
LSGDSCESDQISSDAHSDVEGSSSDGDDIDVNPGQPAAMPLGRAADARDVADRQSVLTDQSFCEFKELKTYVESITKVTMSNNPRTTRIQVAPAWFKEAFPAAEVCWLNGTLYCHQPKKASYDQVMKWAKTTCTCKVRYALCSKTKQWRIYEFDDCHNHEVETQVETSATGIVHIRNAARLNQDMIVAIHNWLDAKQSEYSQLFSCTYALTDTF